MPVSDPDVYEPSKSLAAKIARRLVPLQARRELRFSLDQPVVSFTFDDFPRSSIANGSDILEREGWNATFYVASGLRDAHNHHGQQFTAEDLQALEDRGHEIACHTFSHIDCTTISRDAVLKEIDQNREALRAMGIKGNIDHFAYPFGAVDRKTKRALEKRFKTLRGINPQTNRDRLDLNCLDSAGLFSGKALEHTLRLIKGQSNAPGWLTLFAHDICNEPSKWGCTPDEFETIVDAVKQSGAIVLTIHQAFSHVKENNDS